MAEGSSSATEMSASSSSPDDPVIRVLLMGRNVSGRSSSGNIILGENTFRDHASEVCEGQTQIREKQVCVIDCPDPLDPDLNEEQQEKIKEQLVSRCSGGLSAVLLTVPLHKPEQNEEEILDFMKHVFGPEVQKYIIILLTYECEQDQTIAEQHKDHACLQRLVTECGGKIQFFNNRIKSDDQIQELLHNIEGKMWENGGKFIMKLIKRSDSKANLVNFSGKSPAEDPDSSGS